MRLNPRMWMAALRIIPRIEKDEWDKLDIISRWLIASRGAVLIMTFLSTTLAALLAATTGSVDLGLYVLLSLGLVLAHGSSNLFNDYWDYKQGVDTDNYFRAQYGPHPIISGLMKERQLILWAVTTGMLGLAISLYLTYLRGLWVLAFTAAGALLMLTYAGKPFPLKRIGLGEPVVFITWGPLMVGASYFVLKGELPTWVLYSSLPYALGVTSVLFGKHIDKIEEDTRKGIRTLPVILKERNARIAVVLVVALMYLLTVALILTGYLAVTLLLVFLAIPTARLATRALLKPKPSSPPEGYPKDAWPLWFVGFTFIHNRSFGALFMVGLLVDVVLRFMGITLTIALV